MSERFGDYELLRKIATGGMAEIYLAKQSAVQGFARTVVVKRMLPQLAVRDDFVTMFLDEARLAANLTHPSIVQVFNLGEADGSYYMAMELVDGPHLGALFAHSLRQHNPLPLELCAYAVARAADGLDYAHEQTDPTTGKSLQIVHRDISPQNILVSKHGDVKVTDFGVAKATTQEAKTRTGIIKGKVSYMSPEQCLGDAVDRRTDVFALGIVLYELLTRRRLFRDKSDLLVMQRITTKDVDPPSALFEEVDDELDQICLKALSRDLDRRFQTAAELSEALDVWLALKGHADCRGKLAKWMDIHAPELGLNVDNDEASRPSFADIESIGGPADEMSSGNTVSTPALAVDEPLPGVPNTPRGDTTISPHPPALVDAVSEPSGSNTAIVPQGAIDDAIDGTATEVLPTVDVAFSVDDKTNPDAVHPWEDGAAEKKLPIAALAGGAAAVVLALLIGVVMFSGGDDVPGNVVVKNGDSNPDDPVDEPRSGAQDGAGQDGDDGASTGAKPADVDGTRGGEDTTGEGTAEPGPTVTVHLRTQPAGVELFVGGTSLGKSPVDKPFPLSDETLAVRAAFESGAVTKTLALEGDEATLLLVAPVPLTVTTEPTAAAVFITIEGQDDQVLMSPIEGGVRVTPGEKLAVRVEKEGYDPVTWETRPLAGEAVKRHFVLTKTKVEEPVAVAQPKPARRPVARVRPKPRPTGYGKLTVYSAPWVNVRYGGRSLDISPVRDAKVKAGTATLTVSNAQFGIQKSMRVSVPKNGSRVVKLRFNKEGDTYTLASKKIE